MRNVNQKTQHHNRCIELYNKIVAFIAQFGYPPSLREMCTLMSIRSTSHVRKYVRVLEEWHWIEITDGKCRTLRLIRPTEIEAPLSIRKHATVVSDRMIEPAVGQWMFREVKR